MERTKNKVFAILYRRQLICDNFFLFTPCSHSDGVYDGSDESFIDQTGHPFYSCNNYDIVTDSVDLTYYFDISHNDVKNRYHLNNAWEALSQFYDEIKEVILLGRIDHVNKRIDIISLSRKQIEALVYMPTYQVKDGEGYVVMTKTQIKRLVNESNFESLKKLLNGFLHKTTAIENLTNKEHIKSIKTTPMGDRIVEIIKDTPNQENAKSDDTALNINDSQISKIPKAQEIYEYITNCLIGQDESVQDIVAAIISNLKATEPEEIIKPFIIGETGSGKSFLFKLLGKVLDIPVIIVDCNNITQEGYHGKSVSDVLVDLYNICGKDIKKVEHSIVFFDEVDKLAARGANVSDIGAQQSLLKFIEGNKYAVEVDKFGTTVIIDTSMMMVACGGAFEEIFKKKSHPIGIRSTVEEMDYSKKISHDDLVDFGMLPEFIGRWNLFRQYNKITKEMIKTQLERGLLSPLVIKKKLFLRNYGVTIDFTDSYYEKLCDDALAKKTGFRAIDEVVTDSLIKANFALQISTTPYHRLIVTRETIENPNVYVLEK